MILSVGVCFTGVVVSGVAVVVLDVVVEVEVVVDELVDELPVVLVVVVVVVVGGFAKSTTIDESSS